jgi:hypothetical protein
MKNFLKTTLLVFAISLSFVACDKDDEPLEVIKLTSISYSPNKMEAKTKDAFSSKEATLNPKNASVTFKISKITKDDKSFTNPKDGGFSIDGKGKIFAKKDHKLAVGVYVLEVTATNKSDTKIKKSVSFSVTIK